MSTCLRCQKTFTCAMADQTGQACWCTTMPPVPMPKTASGEIDMQAKCFCPDCLPQWIRENTSAQNTEAQIQLP